MRWVTTNLMGMMISTVLITIYGHYFSKNVLYFAADNTIPYNRYIKHRCLFSKLADRMGAYIHICIKRSCLYVSVYSLSVACLQQKIYTYFCIGAGKHNMVVVIKIGAYIYDVLI